MTSHPWVLYKQSKFKSCSWKTPRSYQNGLYDITECFHFCCGYFQTWLTVVVTCRNFKLHGDSMALLQASKTFSGTKISSSPQIYILKDSLTDGEGPRVWKYLPWGWPAAVEGSPMWWGGSVALELRQTRMYVQRAAFQGVTWMSHLPSLSPNLSYRVVYRVKDANWYWVSVIPCIPSQPPAGSCGLLSMES